MRTIEKIILHCSATKEGQNFTTNDIDSWHRQRGFAKIGYHYVVYLDGSVHKGRTIDEIGAHCTGQNANSIGICYIGGLDANGTVKDTRTDAQKIALVKLVTELKGKFSNPTIHGHYQFANKACPCFDVDHWVKENNL